MNIITLVQPNTQPFNIEEFKKTRIKLDPAYAGLTISDIGCIIQDSTEYDKLSQSDLNTKLRVNKEKGIVEIDVFAKTCNDK